MTFFRVQTADRDVADLLDPGHQFSHSVSHDPGHTREGVSVCDSIDDLAMYLASHLGAGIGVQVQENSWVIVELDGDPISGARVVDPEFETLVRPTAILNVRPVDEAFMALIAEQAGFLATFDRDPAFDFED